MARKVSTASGEKRRSPTTSRPSLYGSCVGYRGTNPAWSTDGSPPTALSTLATSTMCSISSITTLRMISAASTLVPSSIE